MSTLHCQLTALRSKVHLYVLLFKIISLVFFNVQNPWIAYWGFAMAGDFPEPIDCLRPHTDRLFFDRTVQTSFVLSFAICFLYMDPVQPICAFSSFAPFFFLSFFCSGCLLFLLCELVWEFSARKAVQILVLVPSKKRLRFRFSSGVEHAFHF